MEKSRFVQLTRQKTIAEEEFYPAINAMYEQIWQNLLPQQVPTQGLSNTVAGNVITPAETPIPDCQTCGACCASLLCVGVRPAEQVEPADYWEITAEDESGNTYTVDRFLRRDGETLACTALDGEVGERVGCRIYEQRPHVCRFFEAGSDRCHAIRRAFGLEPFLTLEEMAAARRKLDCGPAAQPAKIQRAEIVPQPQHGYFGVQIYLQDGSAETIHTYDPQLETWYQFQFDGLTPGQAKELIAARKQDGIDAD